MLIVLEGLDGAGKSTQLKMVTAYLATLGREVKYLHFPRYDAPLYGDLISKFLRGDFGSIDQVHPNLVALLFAEDRHGAGALIRSWLEEGFCVVLDRYVYSNIAFQCAKMPKEGAGQLRDWIINTEYGLFNIPRPDLNLFLDVPISFVDSRLKASREEDSDRDYLDGKSDIHEADINFQIRVRELYLEQCALDSRFIRIDCSGPDGKMLQAQEIFDRIKEKIDFAL